MTTIYNVALLLLLATIVKSQEQDHDQHADLLNSSQSWGYGILAGFFLSMIGFIAAIVLVCCKSRASDGCFQIVIKFFFCLACGALIGDAMIHILPQAYTSVDPVYVSLIFILALLMFIIIDRLFHHFGIAHTHWHSQNCHDDHQGAIGNHDHPRKIQNMDEHKNCRGEHECQQSNQMINQSIIIKVVPTNHDVQNNSTSNVNKESNVLEESQKGDEKDKTCWQNLKGKGSAGYMNLIGSFIHNFMDGLALGAAFGTGDKSQYIPVIIAIIAHQIPREMGDVAIMMTSKFNGTQTILCNGFVNFMSLIGVIIGLAVTNLSSETQTYIMVFVAGNFMYIAGDIWRNMLKNSSLCKNLMEFFGFGLGIGLMYVVLFVEQQEGGHDH